MKYPNLELYAGLKPCEDDLFDLINKNFFLIDTYWMLRIQDFVDELPLDPSQGDAYIIDDKIAIFDGKNWIYTDLKNGMYFYNLGDHDLYFYDNGLTSFGARFGKFPDESLDNSVAIFDGTTGKFITDSGVTITDRTVLNAETIYSESIHSDKIFVNDVYGGNGDFESLESQEIYAQDIYSENSFVTTLAAETAHADEFSSDDAQIENLSINNSLTLKSVDVTLTGSNQAIPDIAGVQAVLLGSSIISISSVAKTEGNILTIINKTGKKVLLVNGLGISTGLGKDLNIEIDGSVILQRRTGSDWYVTGGSSSGGGQSLATLLQLTADESASDWTEVGSSFEISKTNPLQGDASYALGMTAGDKATHKGVAVDPAFRQRELALVLIYKGVSLNPITGTAKIILRDQADAIIQEFALPTITSEIQKFGKRVFIPSTVISVKFEIEATSTVADEHIQFDSIELSSDLLKSVDIGDKYQQVKLYSSVAVNGTTNLDSLSKTLVKGNSSLFSLSSEGVTALTDISVSTTAFCSRNANTPFQWIRLNGVDVSNNAGGSNTPTWGSASVTLELSAGDKITYALTPDNGYIVISAKSRTKSLVTPTDQVTERSIAFRWRSPAQATEANLSATGQIGDYVTGQYAINTNTLTQCTTRPDQSDADMSINGPRIYTRAFNAASTAALPARIVVKIAEPNQMAACDLILYKNTTKNITGSLDYYEIGVNRVGSNIKQFNPTTGILTIDLGWTSSDSTAATLVYDDGTFQPNGYICFTASKLAQGVAIPVPARYVVKTYQSGNVWYEVYNDGWVRQAGRLASGANGTMVISLLVAMANTDYIATTQAVSSDTTAASNVMNALVSFSTSSISINRYTVISKMWKVEGYGDSATVKSHGAIPNYD